MSQASRTDPVVPLTETALIAALERAGLTVRPAELADVLTTARYLEQALALIRAAL